jgi:hypothetical protein
VMLFAEIDTSSSCRFTVFAVRNSMCGVELCAVVCWFHVSV